MNNFNLRNRTSGSQNSFFADRSDLKFFCSSCAFARAVAASYKNVPCCTRAICLSNGALCVSNDMHIALVHIVPSCTRALCVSSRVYSKRTDWPRRTKRNISNAVTGRPTIATKSVVGVHPFKAWCFAATCAMRMRYSKGEKDLRMPILIIPMWFITLLS